MSEITIGEIVSHYNIIGMAIAIAIGVAGQQFLFSITDNMIVPLINKVIKVDKRKNNFDVRKVFSSLLTLLFVFIAVILVLFVILKPMVAKEIKNTNKNREFLESRLNEITQDVSQISSSMEELHEKIPRNSMLTVV